MIDYLSKLKTVGYQYWPKKKKKKGNPWKHIKTQYKMI